MLVKLRCKSTARSKNLSNRKPELDSHIEHYRVKSVFRAYNKSSVKKNFASARETKTMMGSYNLSISPTERRPKKEEKVEPKIEKKAKTEKNFKTIGKKSQYETVVKEILNTKSDNLELKRDIATYEFDFIKNTNFFELVEDFNQCFKSINNLLNANTGFVKSGQELSTKIRETCKNSKECGIYGLNEFIRTEGFSVKKDFEQYKKSEIFSGVWVVSGIRCILSIKTTLFCNHFVSCLIPSGTSLFLQVEKSISDTSSTKKATHSQRIKEKILPFLHINKTSQKLILEFEEQYLNKHTNFYIQLKGAHFPIILILTDSDKNFLFQIKDLNLSLTLEKLSLETQNLLFINLPKLKQEILNHLFIYKKKLVWGNHPFEVRERSSKFMDVNFLRESFDESLKKIFSLKIYHNRRGFKIEGIETIRGKYLKIFNNNAIVVINEFSQDFSFLFGMQYLNFYKDFVTIAKSLEMGVVIKRLFNY